MTIAIQYKWIKIISNFSQISKKYFGECRRILASSFHMCHEMKMLKIAALDRAELNSHVHTY